MSPTKLLPTPQPEMRREILDAPRRWPWTTVYVIIMTGVFVFVCTSGVAR